MRVTIDTPWVARHYASWNLVPFEQLTANSRTDRQHDWLLSCGEPKHYKALMLKSLLKQANKEQAVDGVPSTLCCPMCMPGYAKSEREARLLALLKSNPLWYAHQPEVKLLMGKWGALDVFLVRSGVGIMLDGEHHFSQSNPGHHDESSSEQKLIDLRFDLAVLAGERAGRKLRGVVRLHFKDERYWSRHIQRATELAADQRVRVFVIYSSAYKVTGMDYRDAILPLAGL